MRPRRRGSRADIFTGCSRVTDFVERVVVTSKHCAALVLVAACIAGCYRPHFVSGQVRCGGPAADECPARFTCNHCGRCVVEGEPLSCWQEVATMPTPRSGAAIAFHA